LFKGIAAGFISLNMPPAVTYLSDLSPLRWGSFILTNVVFQGKTFTCDASEKNSAGACPLSTGEQVIELYGFTYPSAQNGMAAHMGVLAAVLFGYFLIALVSFRIRAYQLSH
jgi:hypothetical protein